MNGKELTGVQDGVDSQSRPAIYIYPYSPVALAIHAALDAGEWQGAALDAGAGDLGRRNGLMGLFRSGFKAIPEQLQISLQTRYRSVLN